MVTTIYQAEDANFLGALFFTGREATGTGYVDYQNFTGDFIEWTVNVPTADNYDLSWQYANGSSNRPLGFAVNGITKVASLNFNTTNNWAIWGFVNQSVVLNAGINTIRLTANGSSGANFDYLSVSSSASLTPTVIIADTTVTEGENSFLVFDVTLSTASTAPITLRLGATDGTATGGLIANFATDVSGNLDYAKQEFEVSSDGGTTWQTAVNGTDITFTIGQTALKVRLKVNDDTAVEGTIPEAMTLAVASVLSGIVESTSSGIGSIIDNDVSGFVNTYQAENANFVGPLVFSGRGAEGAGYVDYQNITGDFIEWTVTVPTTTTYNLSWRYANGDSNRPLQLAVNGTTQVASLNFGVTGAWDIWGLVNQSMILNAGTNTIRLTAIGSSGANFDYLTVASAPRIVTISNAIATEGTNSFLVFDITLSTASNTPITLNLAATDGTATGGLRANFATDLSGNLDYVNQEFEVSRDNGATWEAVFNGYLTFVVNQTALKVRLAVNDDKAVEGFTPETMTLSVSSVLSGTVNDITDRGVGLIVDNDNDSAPGAPISLLPYNVFRITGNRTFNFNGTDGGLVDVNGDLLGFTMVDPTPNLNRPIPPSGVIGYLPQQLDVDPINGVLKLTTTSGIQYLNNNSLDNALGIGLNLPSKTVILQTTLLNLPTPVGGSAQAGLWFGKGDGGVGSSQDNYIKLIIISNTPGNYLLQALLEQNGVEIATQNIDIPDNLTSVALSLAINPVNKTVMAQYSLEGGTQQTLITFNDVPNEWFSFDQAGINPLIATRSFGGIFATNRNASSSEVFTFDNFSVTEENPLPPFIPSPISFDRWSIPINNATAMALGPDGRLYVATLLGTIHALTINYNNRTFTDQVINTIRTNEGGDRLTLGLAIDPDSTADNVILWVAHSSGSLNNGDLNSGTISRLSGTGFTQKNDVITGLPRSISNHATNNIKFGPDGRLYIFQGGNTGIGSANNNPNSEFGNRPEQVLSAAVVVADIPKWKANPNNFNGNVASPLGEFIDQFYARKTQELGRPYTDVQIYASGVRNPYSGVFHTNGSFYVPNNGLGSSQTVPPVPRLGSPTDRTKTTLLGDVALDNPGTQPDSLYRVTERSYYGHPNPYRDEAVFGNGSFQGLSPLSSYQSPFFNLGLNRSPNGIIEYTANNFFEQLKGDLLITNFSEGDDLTRLKLSANGLSVINSSSLVGGFAEPLPIEMGPNGSIFVGEFNGGKVTILDPLGIWRNDLPQVPQAILNAGSTTLNGALYMIGGKTHLNGTENHISNMYIYRPGDPITTNDDLWTSGLSLPGPAVENPAVVSLNDKVYVFGGSTSTFSGAVNNVAVFNPDADPDPTITTPTWSSLEPMLLARGGATAQVLNGNIYVIGGMDATGASVDTVQIYNPSTNSWSNGSSMQIRRDNLGSAVINDKLYVFGGKTRNTDGTTINQALNSMEIFDPLTGQWSFGTSMFTGRRNMSVGTLNNRIQVIGGEATSNALPSSQNEEYNPITQTWRSLPSMPTPVHGAAFGTIDNVIYMAAGGPFAGLSTTDSVQAFTL